MHRILCRNPKIKPGDQFNRLTAIGPEFRTKRIVNSSERGCRWQLKYASVYRCECGSFTVQIRNDVLSGKVMSCGCHRLAVLRAGRRWTHRGSATKLYGLWHLIKLRCHTPGQPNYPDYGGRGISVCDEWRNSFEAFREWAMSHGYRPGLQIDRFPDNNGNYEPGNCRFTTCKLNNNNRRSSVFVEWIGERKTLKQWAEDCRCVVKYHVLWRRYKDGWDFGKAMTVPPLPRGRARRYRIIP